MADSYRIITDGAGQQIVDQLAELLAVITTGSASSVNASSYTSKAPLTEDSGRSVASQLASLTTAFASYYEDKQKLDGIEDSANNYSLPTATASVLGGIKAAAVRTTAPTKTTGGTTASRYYGVEMDSNGVAFVHVPWSNTTYSAATTSAAGLMSASDKTKLDGIEESANNYSLPTATSTTLGGVMLGSSTTQTVAANTASATASRTYAVQMNSSSQLVVNVPWTDNNTNYYPTTWTWTAGTTSGPTASLSGSGMSAVSVAAIPAASASASGVVTTGAQTFAGTKTFSSTIGGDISGNAATATKLAASKTIRTNLASTSTASFDGSANITPGVTGTLPVGNGGTGKSAAVGSTSKPVYLSSSGIAEASNVYASCLEDMSWDEISAISLAGKAPSIFHVGQEKTIELSDGETVTAVILGFNHDDLADGSGKAGITFGLKNALKTTYAMNSSSTNDGGWTSSVMRATNMQTFKGWLPSDLQAVLQTVTKKTSTGSASSTIESTEDELFLFSQVEVFGTYYLNQADSPTQYSYVGEGHQYDYYKGKTSCSYYAKYAIDPFGTARTYTANRYYQENAYKGLSDSATASYTWWLRSPYYGTTTYFCSVGLNGYCYYYYAYGSYGVVFGFCV